MPYKVRKSSECPKSRPWACVKVDGEIMGCHASKAAAERQRAAILANENSKEEKMLTKQRQAEFKARKAEEGATQPGEFEALVAVFDNVDAQGDRIKSGAFDETLEAWRKSGDPIPIVLAHEWSDPWAHIGYALPEHVKSMPGRGLYVSKAVLDIEDNPVARQVHKLMERRTLKEFSFGYRIPEGGEKKAEDGAYDLTNLDLIEFGPCLKGVNDSTELLAVKSLVEAERRRETGAEPTLEERITQLEAVIAGTEVKGQIDEVKTRWEEGKVSFEALKQTFEGTKAYVELAGTFEERQDAIRTAVVEKYNPGDGMGWVSVQGTYPDRVIYEVYADGGDRKTYQVDYTIDTDGNVVLGTTAEVELEASVVPKADEEIQTPGEAEVETPAEDVEAKAEAHAEALLEDAERTQAELDRKAEETGSGEAEARQKSAEIELMLRTQALDNIEAALGFKDEVEETPVESKSLEEELAEVEAELKDPIPFDVGEVRLKQMTDEIESIESGDLHDVVSKDQAVDDAQRKLEQTEKELN